MASLLAVHRTSSAWVRGQVQTPGLCPLWLHRARAALLSPHTEGPVPSRPLGTGALQ